MFLCSKCGTKGYSGFRDHTGKWVCNVCGLNVQMLHYDYYDPESDVMEPPNLGDKPDQHFIDYVYQFLGDKVDTVVKFDLVVIAARNMVSRGTCTWLELVRGFEYYYRIKKNPIKANTTVVGVIPFILLEAKQYYQTISRHHLQKYRAQYKAVINNNVKTVAVNQPKATKKQISMEDI